MAIKFSILAWKVMDERVPAELQSHKLQKLDTDLLTHSLHLLSFP